MQKRHFLSAAALGGLTLSHSAQAEALAKRPVGPGLLTVTGAISRSNRGALNPALDQMMVKQKLSFDRAYVFDFAALLALPAINLRPTLEYDAKPHGLRGPLLADVAKAAGAADHAKLLLRAVDGYAVVLTLADARKYRYIVATHLDDAPMPLGGLGPLWAVYEPEHYPDMAAKPLTERFALCPWGLYHVEVQPPAAA